MRVVDLHHAELIALFQVDGNAADGAVRVVIDVILHDLRVIHLVDVVSGQNQHVIGTCLFDRIDVLVDGVGRALIPVFVDPLLRRQDVDEFVEFAAEESPAEVQMPVEAGGLVLRQHQHAAQATVDAVREGEIDDAVDSPERHGRLRTVSRERFESRPLAPRQDQRHHALHPLPPRIRQSARKMRASLLI